jgi:ketosteroid isomerase-like protein
VDDALARWLEAYGRAWEARDPAAAVRLFSEDAAYAVTPFSEPMRGREEIGTYWSSVTAEQAGIRFGYEVLARPAPDRGIAHWWATFRTTPAGQVTRLDGIFVLDFGSDGLCRSLREWWHVETAPPAEDG